MSETKHKAELAQNILDNPVFQECYDDVVNGALLIIEGTDLDDEGAQKRNQAGLLLQAAAQFKRQLMEKIEDAQAEARAESERQRRAIRGKT